MPVCLPSSIRISRDKAASCMAPGFLLYESVLLSNENHSFDLTFWARFCKAICLQALTIAALFQARAFTFSSEDIGSSTWGKSNCIWLKQFKAICEWASPLSFKQKLEGFEVYDFLYLFLIGKIIPPKALDLWWKKTRAFWTEGDSPSELKAARRRDTSTDLVRWKSGMAVPGGRTGEKELYALDNCHAIDETLPFSASAL